MRMRKMTGRLLSILLSAVMTVGTVYMPVYAAEDDPVYDTAISEQGEIPVEEELSSEEESGVVTEPDSDTDLRTDETAEETDDEDPASETVNEDGSDAEGESDAEFADALTGMEPETIIEEETESEVSLLGDFHTLEGSVDASTLVDNGYYILNGDTVINIEAGDDKHIETITYPYGESGYNLTIQGSNEGKLTIDNDIYPSPNSSTKTLTIKGGTIECGRDILAGGDITISGGNITATATTIRSYGGDITISGGRITSEQYGNDYPLYARNVRITGGYVSSFGAYYPGIYASNDIEITGGVINARSREGSDSYGLSAGGDLTIGGTAYIDAEGGMEAIRCWNTGELSIASGLAITKPSDGVITEDKQHIYSSGFNPRQVHIELASITYAVSADKLTVDFGTADYGTEPPAAQTITITNTGTGPIELDEIDASEITAFDIGTLSDSYLLPSATATFTVRPKANLRDDKEYVEAIAVTTNKEDVFIASITLKYKVNPFPYRLTPSESSVDFGAHKEGDYSEQTRVVTLKNDSTAAEGALSFGQGNIDSNFGLEYFTLEFGSQEIQKGGSINLTISPKYNLEPGTYEETLILVTGEGAKAPIDLRIEVLAWDYTITADKTELDFGRVNVGYVSAPKAQNVKITNAGDKAVTLKDPATYSPYYFDISTDDSLTIEPGEKVTLSVRPKLGWTSGGGNFYVKTEQESEVCINVKFDVGYYLTGNVKVSELINGASYYLVGDTVLTISAGDDKCLGSIKHQYGTLGYNLTIQGSDSGKLTCDDDIYSSPSGSTNKLTITGGTIECGRDILAGGDISISGGSITVDTLLSYAGDVKISGGTINARQEGNDPTIRGDNVTITGGKISAYGKYYPAISSYSDLTITGGIIHAVNIEGSDSYGLYASDNLTIGGTAYVEAKGGYEAIRGFDSLSVADTLQMKSGYDSNIKIDDGTHSHTGHLVDGLGNLVTNVIVGKDLNAISASVAPGVLDFGEMVVGGDAPEVQTVVVKNNSSVPVIIGEITATDYIVGEPSQTMISEGETASFTVQPDASATTFAVEGNYSNNISVRLSGYVDPMTVVARLTVVEPSPDIITDLSGLDFGTVPVGCNEDIEEQTITVTNSGNVAVTLAEPTVTGSDFIDINGYEDVTLVPGESAELTVAVKDDTVAAAGAYESTLKINTTGSAWATVTVRFKVEDVAFDDIWIEPISEQYYTGKAIKPVLNVYYYGFRLTSADYTVSYKNNTKPAAKDATKIVKGKTVSIAPTVTVKGKGNFSGTATTTFTIKQLDIAEADASDIELAYANKVQKAKPVVTYELNGKKVKLKEKTDYTLTYEEGKDYKTPGVYTITVTGKGNYTGNKIINETIADSAKTLISKVKVPGIPNQPYKGEKIILDGSPGTGETYAVDTKGNIYSFILKNGSKVLEYGTDYELTDYTDNLEIGTASVIVRGKGNYVGSRTVTFRITGTALNKVKTEGFASSMAYTGAERRQPMKLYVMKKNDSGVKVRNYLTEGVDYTATYANNTEIGTATVVYKGKGAYTGTLKKTYKITGTSMKSVTIPSDFSVSTGVDVISYKDAYDKKTKSFIYIGKPICVAGKEDGTNNFGIKLQLLDKKKGTATDLELGTDYTVSYKNNILPGKATVIFTGIGKYTGTVKKTFKIRAYDIAKDSDIFGSIDFYVVPTCAYRKGGAIPNMNLKCNFDYGWETLENGKDYTIKYSNNDAVTTSSTKKKPKITVTGKGGFKGSLAKEFTIEAGRLDAAGVKLTVTDVIAKDGGGINPTTVTLLDTVTNKKLQPGKDYYDTYGYYYTDGVDVKNSETGETEHRYDTSPVKETDIIPAGIKIRAKVGGKGYYDDTFAYGDFYIVANDISKAIVEIKPQTYTGNKVTPNPYTDITVKFGNDGTPLTYGTDYEIVPDSYENNVKKGTAEVTIRGKAGSNYGGTKTVTFKITAKLFS